MKTKLFIVLLFPFLLMAQQNDEYLVFMNLMISPNPEKIVEFEKSLTEHNGVFHSNDLTGMRVYQIRSGLNTGKFVVSTATSWKNLEMMRFADGHGEHWKSKVMPTLEAKMSQSFWRLESELSNFPKDLSVKYLYVNIFDIKRGDKKEALEILKKISDAIKKASPDETFGIYVNETGSSKEGRDIAWVYFVESPTWMAQDRMVEEKYDKINGKGKYKKLMKKWLELSNGYSAEIWSYREDLSGINGEIKADVGN